MVLVIIVNTFVIIFTRHNTINIYSMCYIIISKVNKSQFSPNKNPLALYTKKYILQLKKKRKLFIFYIQ